MNKEKLFNLALLGDGGNKYMDMRARAIAVANKHRPFFDQALTAIGRVSNRVEKLARVGLRIAPEYVSVDYSPLGKLLTKPIKMSTQRGTDQISRGLYYYGWRFEHPMPALIEAALTFCPDGAFFDIGANTGLYSLMARALFPAREVYAFEPFPSALKILRENVSLSNFANSIVIDNRAVSDETGVGNLYIPKQDHGLVETSASLSADFRAEHSGVFHVETIRLDGWGFGRTAVIKIDVEGAEGRVLQGAKKILREDRPIVFCEIIRGSKSLDEVLGVLEYADYSFASICKDHVVFSESILGVDNHILFPRQKERLVRDIAKRSPRLPLDGPPREARDPDRRRQRDRGGFGDLDIAALRL